MADGLWLAHFVRSMAYGSLAALALWQKAPAISHKLYAISLSPLPFRQVCYNATPAMEAEVDLFVYGTQMSKRVLYSLTGRCFSRRKAELSGFARIIPKNGYPYIIPRTGARVPGILLSGIDLTALAALDDYEEEGRLYHRYRVEVTVDGRQVPCETYVGKVGALTVNSYDTSQSGK